MKAEFVEWGNHDGECQLNFYHAETHELIFSINPKYVSKNIVDKLIVDIEIEEATVRIKK